ncbi:class I SAM-dependent methyltransferase [Streptomyces sp. JJ38]|uniref:class I SAM-dependent methyltransferase n=1 Tax=Streptomyces sp. JJ38 TaxID=2738128 RepID=UPI001C57CA33|nr:methyltransferase domain-containing protein [Streptomyces sp. JJ38]MBW1598558.1 methyltransferase domain-containing protein [Streptomyces sp. JJ38]
MTMPAPLREPTAQAWDGLAESFDENITPLNLSLGERLLRLAGLRPDERFLDVAAGTGALAVPAARMGAQVLAADFSPEMVARLAARARDEGLLGVEARVMDAQALDLDDGAFDLTGSLNGVTMLPELRRGLAEMVRVTKPGGRVMVAAFGAPPPRTEVIGFFVAAVSAAVPGFTPPLDPPPPPFQLADPERMRQELSDSGLRDVRVETVDWTMEIGSPEHLWEIVASGHPIGAMMAASVLREHRRAVRHELAARLRERAGGDGPALLTNPMNVGIGTR